MDQLAGYHISSKSVSMPRELSWTFPVPGGKETLTSKTSLGHGISASTLESPVAKTQKSPPIMRMARRAYVRAEPGGIADALQDLPLEDITWFVLLAS